MKSAIEIEKNKSAFAQFSASTFNILDIELWINVTANLCAGLYNLLKLDFNEVIVRVNMLLDETFHFEKCR